MERKTQHLGNLLLDLVGGTEDVGVVLGEAAYPQQAGEDAAPFIAVDGAQLRPAQRQVTV